MKKFFLIMVAATFAASPVGAETASQKYTCPMHSDVVMDAPGECPKCGMTLVPVKAEERKRPTPNVQRRTSNEEKTKPRDDHKSHATQASDETGGRPMTMASSLNLAEPMSRESSGSSWVPDSTPMYGRMLHFGDDMLMLHGAVWPRYTNANTRRGDDRIDAPNWFMAMYSHPFSQNAQLGFRLMMSLDPLTEGGRGYPLLFQTGETWD